MKIETDLKQTAILISALTIVSKGLGVIREIVTAAFYGTSLEMDAFVVANAIPTIVGLIIQMGISTAFIPIYNEYIAREDHKGAERLVNTVVGLVFAITSALCLVVYIYCSQIISMVAPGFSNNIHILAVELTRIMIPSLPFYGLLGVAIALQQAHKIFLYPALIGVPFNIIFIAIVYFFAFKFGIYIAAIATTLAAIVQLIIQWPGVAKCNYQCKVDFDISHPGIRKIAILIIPTMLGMTANHINIFIDRILASTLPQGSIAALNYASKINIAFFGIFILPIITAVFPTISRYAAKNEINLVKHHINVCIRIVFFIIMPTTVLLVIFRKSIIAILLQRGAFDLEATTMTAYALLFFSFGLLGMSLMELFARVFYALKDTKTFTIITCIVVAINVILNFILVNYFAHGGLALATSIALSIGALLSFTYLYKKLGGIDGLLIGKSILKIIATSTVMGFFSYLIHTRYLGESLYWNNSQNQIFILGINLILAMVVYLVFSKIFHCEELKMIYTLVKPIIKRFKRDQ